MRPLAWKYSKPWSTPFKTVAMVTSSRTPPLESPSATMCLIMSSSDPATNMVTVLLSLVLLKIEVTS